jgi:nucleoside-diphosphate-sugar epimerase
MGRRTILITGSSGRLGSALAAALKGRHAIVQLDARAPSDDQCGVGRVFTGRVTDPALVAEAMDGVDTVIHCAAIPSTRKPYHAVVESNVMGTFHVLEAAGNSKKVEQFIYISSLTWHGLSESPFTNRPLFLPISEDHPSLAVDYYACSKVQAEYWCEKYVARFRKPVVAVRPPMIVTLKAQPEFRAGPAPEFPHLNDYVGTSDLIDGILRCMDYEPPGGFDRFLFHAVDQRSTSPTLELIDRYWPKVNCDREKLILCDGFAAMIDCARARDRLGWAPHFRCLRT